MMDHVLADAAHDEGGKGAFAAVSHNNEVDIFFVHQGGDDAAGDAGADDGGEGKALGNLFFDSFHDCFCFFPDRGEAVSVKVDLH